jgi:ABC-2 type transport system ATP-binding protein
VGGHTPWVAVSGLTKYYGRLAALNDVSFGIRRGEILGLIGPNGAGKTTLFECLAGVLPPSSGTIARDGRSLTPRERSELIFYVPDAIAPWPSQPVEWVLDFGVGFFGGDASRLEDVIDALALQTLLKHQLGTLSKGQRKRVLLAFGLLMRQPILLADEPLDGLDLRQSREVGAALREHVSDGRTLFLSIHQISDAARLCHRFVLLSDGRTCGEGTLDDLAAVAAASGSRIADRNLEEIFLALT